MRIQDDVSRMSKNSLEHEVRRLRAKVSLLEYGMAAVAQTLASTTDNDARAEGWNAAINLFTEYFEPLTEIAWEIESQIGSLKAYVISAERVHGLSKIAPLIKEYAEGIGDLLSKADPFNRAMAAPFDDIDLWVDFSFAWKLYDAALNFVNKGGKNHEYAKQLVDLSYRKDPASQFLFDLTAVLKPTRHRESAAPKEEIGKAVQALIDGEKRLTPGEAIAAVHLDLCTGERRKYSYAKGTIKSMYYEWRGELELVRSN